MCFDQFFAELPDETTAEDMEAIMYLAKVYLENDSNKVWCVILTFYIPLNVTFEGKK